MAKREEMVLRTSEVFLERLASLCAQEGRTDETGLEALKTGTPILIKKTTTVSSQNPGDEQGDTETRMEFQDSSRVTILTEKSRNTTWLVAHTPPESQQSPADPGSGPGSSRKEPPGSRRSHGWNHW